MAELYGAPLKEFTRTAVLCGSNVVFGVDRIKSDVPVKVVWNWLLDNRDGALLYDFDQPGFISADRPGASMRIRRFGPEGRLSGPTWAMLHDAYHTLPGRFCEGKPGSGISFRITEDKASESSLSVHVILLDEGGAIDGWTCSEKNGSYTAENKDRRLGWTLSLSGDGSLRISGEGSLSLGKDWK